MSMLFLSSSITIDNTSAGCIELITKRAMSSSQGIISTRSLFISFVTVWIREPRIPTQAPPGSRLGTFARTAILEREPGSRAAPMMSIRSCPISGTSSLTSSTKNSSSTRETIIRGPPRPSSSISSKMPRIRSPVRAISRGIIWSRGIIASLLSPRSKTMPRRSTRLTVPSTI